MHPQHQEQSNQPAGCAGAPCSPPSSAALPCASAGGSAAGLCVPPATPTRPPPMGRFVGSGAAAAPAAAAAGHHEPILDSPPLKLTTGSSCTPTLPLEASTSVGLLQQLSSAGHLALQSLPLSSPAGCGQQQLQLHLAAVGQLVSPTATATTGATGISPLGRAASFGVHHHHSTSLLLQQQHHHHHHKHQLLPSPLRQSPQQSPNSPAPGLVTRSLSFGDVGAVVGAAGAAQSMATAAASPGGSAAAGSRWSSARVCSPSNQHHGSSRMFGAVYDMKRCV